MGTIRVDDNDGDVSAVVIIQMQGESWTVSYAPVDEVVPIPRRWVVTALRQLADSLEAEAVQIGD